MEHSLIAHSSSSSTAVKELYAKVARSELGDFVLHFRLVGNLQAIKLPEPVPYGSRRDELWRETCFEAFVKPEDGGAYAEFNFAPSTAWAGYKLRSYRAELEILDIPLCVIDVERGADRLDMFVTLDASDCAALPADRPWQLGLSAIVEEKNGTKSYWALRHPPEGPPDFHHPDCFALTLPPPGGA